MRLYRPCCLLALCSLILPTAATHAAAAALHWDRTEARVEMAPDEERVQAAFKVTNKGSSTVRIARVKTSCGCTGSILDRRLLKPGDSSEIVATFNKGNRQGRNHNRLEVFLDSQPDAVATLHMIVEIPRLVDLQPQIVYWNNRSSQTKRSVRVKLDERYVDAIDTIDYDASTLSLERAEGDKPGTYTLEVLPLSFDTTMRQTVTVRAVETDGERVAEGRLHVFVQP